MPSRYAQPRSKGGTKKRYPPFQPGDSAYSIQWGSPPNLVRVTVIARAGGKNVYRVRVEGDPAERLCHLFPGEWQTDPKRALGYLVDLWRATVMPEEFTLPAEAISPAPNTPHRPVDSAATNAVGAARHQSLRSDRRGEP